MSTKGGANSKGARGGARTGAGRPRDIDLERLVVELAEAFGYHGDARVNPDRIVDGKIVRGEPWATKDDAGVRPTSIRDAARMVARRHLADRPLEPAARARMEGSLAERIRRAYLRTRRAEPGDEPWRTIEIEPGGGMESVMSVFEDDGEESDE